MRMKAERKISQRKYTILCHLRLNVAQLKIKGYSVKFYVHTRPSGAKNHVSVPNEIIRID